MSRFWMLKYWLKDRIPFVVTVLVILLATGIFNAGLSATVARTDCYNAGYSNMVVSFGLYYCQVTWNGTTMTVPIGFAREHALPWGRDKVNTPKEKTNG